MASSLRLIALTLALGAASAAHAQDKYNVALDGTFAPHAMPKLGGGVEGFNVDLANAVGEKLGVEMDITATQWSGLLPALQAGTYDFIVAPTTVTEERAESLLFTEGYLNTDFQFVVKAGHEPVTDLKQFAGKTIAVNKGSVYDSWARELEPEIGWTVESYGTNADAVQAVISGRADANVAGNTASQWLAKKSPELDISYNFVTGKVWAMPFRKDDAATRDKVEAALECLKLDGTMAALSEKWFGVTPPEGAAAVTVQVGFGEPGYNGYDETPHEATCD
ncbi:transporter substrate-binding domain-containing protein [Acuticoccus sp. MNP-M23]|uniref:transporter substrate-binding domain-containing protein n=1 Tax=Acuticoccus sp. MNP-M23 TaxID=3072793 RepID=UPI00281617D3|nr:transporter substrate-binding domain-containing protein [Acuticoccus sp. MNP-M23]WMS44033.1 transporter substrate-binding domain-containing protein [Acuticoccus sp. MNP-M23]